MSQETKDEELLFPVKYKGQAKAYFQDDKSRRSTWEDSIKDRFWGNFAKKNIDWFAPFDRVQQGSFSKEDIGWFLNGKLNVSYNCIDRWVKYKPNSIAIIWEGNDPKDRKEITFKELEEQVCKMANVLKKHGIRKGDVVAIYMPMIPQATYGLCGYVIIFVYHV